MKFKYIAFDVDGTLIDTAASEMRVLAQALDEIMGDPLPEGCLQMFFGTSGRAGLARMGYTPGEIERIYPRWLELSNATIGDNPMFPGVEEMLDALAAAGAKMGVVTSRTHKGYQAGEERCHLERYFSTAVCAEDTERHKPYPDPLLAYLERAGARPEETLYVGDSAYDMACAEAAGVPSALALWGANDKELLAGFRAETPAALLRYITSAE